MAKHKSVKEMMAERKPLMRKPVEPVNIYGAPPVEEAEQSKQGFRLKSLRLRPRKLQLSLKMIRNHYALIQRTCAKDRLKVSSCGR